MGEVHFDSLTFTADSATPFGVCFAVVPAQVFLVVAPVAELESRNTVKISEDHEEYFIWEREDRRLVIVVLPGSNREATYFLVSLRASWRAVVVHVQGFKDAGIVSS